MDLQELGISPKETAIYMELLTHGPQTVRQLSNTLQEQRTNCYLLLDSLIQAGLVSRNDASKVARFSAEPPERLKSLVLNQQLQLKNVNAKITEALPELTALHKLTTEQRGIAYFQGVKGYAASLDNMNQSETEVLVLGSDESYNYPKVYELLQLKLVERKNRGIPSRLLVSILPQEPITSRRLEQNNIQYRRLAMPYIEGEIAIYDEKVAFTTYGRLISTLVVSDVVQARTFRALFEILWSGAH